MESELESILGKDAAAVVKLSPSKRLESLRSIARNFPTGEVPRQITENYI